MENDFHLQTILANMCRLAEANYLEIDMSEKDWYRKHSWSEENQKIFLKWFANYIHKMPDAQKELYNKSYMKKPECMQAAQWFVLQYGWSYC